MTLSTSAKKCLKHLIIWSAVAAFCGIFSVVYEHFSHGVYSDFMVWLFLFPLLCGALPCAFLLLPFMPAPGRFAVNAWNSGVATITLASCMTGIFEIYGSVSNLVPLYWIAGFALLICGCACYLISVLKG